MMMISLLFLPLHLADPPTPETQLYPAGRLGPAHRNTLLSVLAQSVFDGRAKINTDCHLLWVQMDQALPFLPSCQLQALPEI